MWFFKRKPGIKTDLLNLSVDIDLLRSEVGQLFDALGEITNVKAKLIDMNRQLELLLTQFKFQKNVTIEDIVAIMSFAYLNEKMPPDVKVNTAYQIAKEFLLYEKNKKQGDIHESSKSNKRTSPGQH